MVWTRGGEKGVVVLKNRARRAHATKGCHACREAEGEKGAGLRWTRGVDA